MRTENLLNLYIATEFRRNIGSVGSLPFGIYGKLASKLVLKSGELEITYTDTLRKRDLRLNE